MLNKELLLVSKHDYTLIYRLGDDGRRYGYFSNKFGQVLYDDVEANTRPDKQWKAFQWFFYDSGRDTTSIELDYSGAIAPGSPDVFINGTLYYSDHGSIYLKGDPFNLEGLRKTESPLYLDIKYP